jgi:hypothetical protein
VPVEVAKRMEAAPIALERVLEDAGASARAGEGAGPRLRRAVQGAIGGPEYGG